MPNALIVSVVLAAVHAVLVVWASVKLSTNRRPSSAIAWVLAIVFVPFLGACLYLLIGRGSVSRPRRQVSARVFAQGAARQLPAGAAASLEGCPDWLPSALALTGRLGAEPAVGGNRVRLLPDYAESLGAIAEAIDAALEYVHVEFYILVRDDTTRVVFDALSRARARGVPVRVLSDFVTALQFPGRTETRALLADIGAEYHAMLPVQPARGNAQRPDLRNHRKLVVVDGRVAFAGSQNLIDASYLKPGNIRRGLQWKELMLRVEGPLAAQLNTVFLADWESEGGSEAPLGELQLARPAGAASTGLGAGESGLRELSDVTGELGLRELSDVTGESGLRELSDVTGQVVASGPSFANDNTLKLFTTMIHGARQRVCITSPYFVPDEAILLAIISAAERGVAVELFVSEVGDQPLVYHAQRSYYEALLRAGVRIWLYPEPTVLHAKHMSVDEDACVIGSSNMDIRSFYLNMEVTVLLVGAQSVRALRTVEDAYRAVSRELELATWLARPRGQQVADNLARLTSSLQ